MVIQKLDLCSFQAIRDFVSEFQKHESKLHVLIHNAGYGGGAFKTYNSHDGLEMTMATNYFGPFLLTHLLIDLLKKSAPSRIVVVASIMHKVWHCSKNNICSWGVPIVQYCKSKRAEIMFTLELARRLQGTGVTANCLHPGVISTGIWRNVGFPWIMCLSCIKLCMINVEEGSRSAIHCATSDEVQGVTGQYFNKNGKEATLSKSLTNVQSNKSLWDATKLLVQLKGQDPKI